LAEAELNPWVEAQTNDAQIIQTSGAIVQTP
jgi:hypothetical protein